MNIAVVGLGNIGGPIARGLAAAGQPVIVATSEPAKAEAFATDAGSNVTPVASVAAAVAQAEVIVFAVYADAEKALSADPSNPIALDVDGTFTRSLPREEAVADTLSVLLPEGAHYVKAFGTLPAASLTSHRNTSPELTALYYAPSDETGASATEQVIRAAGFGPVRVNGDCAALRLEFGGNLVSLILTVSQARARL
ncbi:NAD(P)-binding domain-containing protein [Microbacterium resistens]|uniref:NAD(P)-binding domain-containing protein n=1 Tax=Microbacterium resistens TaxID=156977 RepID=UPI00366F8614